MEHPITFTQKQYLALVKAVQMADAVYGIMGDMVDKKFKKPAAQMDELEDLILRHADKFGMSDMVEEFMGRKHIANGKMEEFMDDLFTFEQYAMWDNLARQLAGRDMERIYTQKQLEEMDRMKYIELEYTIEEKYHTEFEKHDLNRIEIQE